MFMLSLYDSILLGCLNTAGLMYHAMLIEKIQGFTTLAKFQCIIASDYFDMSIYLRLSHCHKGL